MRAAMTYLPGRYVHLHEYLEVVKYFEMNALLRMLLDMQILSPSHHSFRLQLIHQKTISAGRAPTPIDMNCRELL